MAEFETARMSMAYVTERFLGGLAVAYWNDADARTSDEVFTLLAQASKAWDAEHTVEARIAAKTAEINSIEERITELMFGMKNSFMYAGQFMPKIYGTAPMTPDPEPGDPDPEPVEDDTALALVGV